MKKAVSFFLALLLALGCAGCSGAQTSEPAQTPSEPASLPQSEAQTAPQAVTLPQTVLYDEAGIKITATGLSEGSLFGPQIDLVIENNSDAGVAVQSGVCTVNGWVIESTLSQEVLPGKKAETGLTLLQTDLDNARVETIAQIECELRLIDPDNFQTLAQSGPIVLATDAALPDPYQPEGTELYADEGVRIVALEQADSLMGKSVRLCIENNSEQQRVFTASDVSVDGYMTDGSLYVEIPAGRRAMCDLLLLDSEENSDRLEQMSSLEFTLNSTDPDDFTDRTALGPFTLTF